MDVSASQHLHPTRSTPHLWSGMILQAKGDLRGAVDAYNASKHLSAPYDWQAAYRLWKALLLIVDDGHTHEVQRGGGLAFYTEAAAREEAELRARWGDVAFGWYANDVDGALVPFAAATAGQAQ